MSFDWFRTAWNQTLDFSNHSSWLNHGLDSAWSGGEHGAWTLGPIARLAFRFPEPLYETYLCLHASAIEHSYLPFTQEIRVLWNGQPLSPYRTYLGQRAVLIYPLKRSALQNTAVSVLSFLLPNAMGRGLVEESDKERALGITVHAIRWVDIWYDYQLGQRVLTNSGFIADRYFLFGWSEPESEFIWSNTDTAVMLLRVNPYPRALLFRANCKTFLPNRDFPPMVVSVFANDQYVGDMHVEDSEPREVAVSISHQCQREDGLLYLRFEIHSPRCPRDFGFNDDGRRLGFAMSDFCLEPSISSYDSVALEEGTSKGESLASDLSWVSEGDDHELSLRACEVDRSLLLYGWGEPNCEGSPIDCRMAILAIELPKSSSRWRMEFLIRLNACERTAGETLNVFVGEIRAAQWELQTGLSKNYSLTIWPSMVGVNGHTLIRFELASNITEPCSLIVSSVRLYPAFMDEDLFVIQLHKTVSFAHDRTAEAVLGEGWAGIDQDGAWSDCGESSIAFTPEYMLLPLSVEFDLGWLTDNAPESGSSSLLVSLNGRVRAQVKSTGIHVLTIALTPEDLLDDRCWLDFRFTVEDGVIDGGVIPVSPTGYRIERNQSVCINESQLRPVMKRDNSTTSSNLAMAAQSIECADSFSDVRSPVGSTSHRLTLRKMTLISRGRRG